MKASSYAASIIQARTNRPSVMNVNLSYGRGHLPVEFPDDCTTVIEPTYVVGLADQPGAVRDAVRDPVGTRPLRDLAQPGLTVAVSICDVTRPMPSRTVLPVILAELSALRSEDIVVLVATGTHRATTDAELVEMLGAEIVSGYRVVNPRCLRPVRARPGRRRRAPRAGLAEP